MLASRGVHWSIHYIDDFLTAGSPNSLECFTYLACIISTCEELGFPIKKNKLEDPTTCLEYLGIILDTRNMELRLPEEKVTQLMALLQEWAAKRSCRKRELL